MSRFEKSRNRWRGACAGAVIVLTCLAIPRTGFGYCNREHQRIADQAYQILNLMRRGQFLPAKIAQVLKRPVPAFLTSRPDGVPPAEEPRWQRFVQEALAAPDKLDGLLSGLGKPPFPSDQCLNSFPQTQPGHNIEPISDCPAGGLAFAPDRGWGEKNSTRCYIRRGYYFGDTNSMPEFYQSVPNKLTGALLGYWAQNVDEEVADLHVSMRPTNSLFTGAVGSVVQAASEDGLTVLTVPFTCFLSFLIFTGGNCLDAARSASHEADPMSQAGGLVDINLGDWSGSDLGDLLGISFSLTGLWHFLRPQASGDFNRIPGMKMLDAGSGTVLENFPMDKIDAGAIALVNQFGLTVNPDNSAGVARYSQYADGPIGRQRSDWVSTSFAFVEFEPLDNVARYGWDSGGASHTSARYLAWPLHAIVDVLDPHHVAGVLGWHHSDFENYAGDKWPDIFSEGDLETNLPLYYDYQRILAEAYRYWCQLEDLSWDQDPSVALGRYVEAIAAETLADPDSTGGKAFQSSNVDANYDDVKPYVTRLLKRGIGAVLAMMVKETTKVNLAGAPTDPCFCAEGTGRLGMDANGKLIHTNLCTACGTGVFAGISAWLDGACVPACPQDKPFSEPLAGYNPSVVKCVASCQTPNCSGVSCPLPERPFVQNGVCVDRCDDTTTPPKVVAHNRICQDTCPQGQTKDVGSQFCVPAPTTHNCGDISQDAYVDCCRLPGCACFEDGDCDSGKCGPDGACQGQPGQECRHNKDCISGNCQDGVCKGGVGDACNGDQACASGVCQMAPGAGQGQCTKPPGEFCGSEQQACGPLGGCHFCQKDPPNCSSSDWDCEIWCYWQSSNGGRCQADSGCCSNYCNNGTCSPGRGVGEPCEYPYECRGNATCTNGVCTSCRETGCACSGAADCDSLVCHAGNADAGTWSYCLGATGDSCASGYQCASGVCQDGICGQSGPGASCVVTSDCLSGHCEGAQPGQPGSCVSSPGGTCSADSHCSQPGRCQAGHCCLANGAWCGYDSRNSDCCDNNCWSGDGLCHPYLYYHEPCVSDGDCRNRKCSADEPGQPLRCHGDPGTYCESSVDCEPPDQECRLNKCCLKKDKRAWRAEDCCSGQLFEGLCTDPLIP